jgi:hypothetical protein
LNRIELFYLFIICQGEPTAGPLDCDKYFYFKPSQLVS